MSNRFVRLILLLILLLIMVSIVTELPQTMQALQGLGKRQIASSSTIIADSPASLMLRLMRELVLFVILVIMTFQLLIARKVRSFPFSFYVNGFLLGSWALLVAYLTVFFRGLPPVVAVVGLRIVEYVPLAFIGYLLSKNSSENILIHFAANVRWYAGIMAAIGLIQVIFSIGPPNTTIFGIRAYGPFLNYNLYGLTMATCCLTFVLADMSAREAHLPTHRFRTWALLCFAMTVLSGSRTSIIAGMICLSYLVFIRLNRLLKCAAAAVVPIGVALLILVVSLPELSGRELDVSEEGRMQIWTNALDQLGDASELIFGWGLGLATNAIGSVFPENTFPKQIGNPHNLYLSLLGGYGLWGLASFIFLKIYTLLSGPRAYAFLFIGYLTFVGLPYCIFEFFPVNVMLLFLWGVIIAMNTRPRDGAADISGAHRLSLEAVGQRT